MSAEPKQTIGDQLRAFAKQRRDAAREPFEPHPMTRKLLQDEVARTFSARTIARQTTPISWFAAFWRRSAVAGGLIALLVIGAVFWLGKEPEQTDEFAGQGQRFAPAQPLASSPAAKPSSGPALGRDGSTPSEQTASAPRQQEERVQQRYGLIPAIAPEPDSFLPRPDVETAQAGRKQETERVDVQSPAKLALQRTGNTVPSAPGTETLAAGSAVETKPGSTTAQTLAKSHPTSENEAAKVGEKSADSTAIGRGEAATGRLREAKDVASALTTASRTEARFSLGTTASATNVFFFSQTDGRAKYRRNFNSPPVPPVLRSFQVQQSGATVRILDSDGSVYEGVAEPLPTDPRLQLVDVESSNQKKSAEKLSERPVGADELKMLQRQVQPGAPAAANNMEDVIFRASGTNQSVKQLVVISGQLQSDRNQSAVARNRSLGAAEGISHAVTLRAKASIGRNVEIPIEASGTIR
ncbi:MAG: hypothetical protein L0Z50_31590 [Verrucomicrobiales bacterium]|nr:hypothetical protein [Verrucomicrobiales bacterium]